MGRITSNKKTFASVIFCLVVAVVLGVVLFYPGASNDTVVIGGVLPLTGDAGAFGLNTQKGIELAIAEAETRGDIEPGLFVAIFEDSKGKPTQAVSATRKLIDLDGADVLIGDVTSAGTQAIISTINSSKTPTISPSASDPALSGASAYFARVWPSDDYESSVIAGFARDSGHKNIAVVFAKTDYGVAMLDAFRRNLGKDGESRGLAPR